MDNKNDSYAIRGIILGWALTAKSLGLVIAPILSELCVRFFGLESCFIVCAFLYIIIIPFLNAILKMSNLTI